MADLLDASGLTVSTATEITQSLSEQLKSIYGDDIVIDQNSPDGQAIGIVTQMAIDLRELLVSINNSFDPDQAEGKMLDQRVVINNITRKGGTYTAQPITITVDRTVTLNGLDADYDLPNGTGYTVQDDAGNKFILADTVTLTAGSHSLNFRAKTIGYVSVPTGTITNPVTIVLGVTGINNPSSALEVGVTEETDAQLKIRREQSVSNVAVGYEDSLRGNLLQIDGVSEAKVFMNRSGTVDSDGIPAHGIWCIVEGGANTDIGQVIYSKLNFGANMKGAVSTNIATASGGVFVARFDRPTAENLYVKFDIKQTVTGYSFDEDGIKDYIAANMSYKIGEFAETSAITASALAAINSLGGGGVPINVEISKDGSTWVDYLDTTGKDNQFTISADDITITVV